MPRFDLIREPWIPVVIAGQRVELSLLDALLRAHEVEQLALDEPLEAVAVLRQALLPVLLDATDAPRDVAEWRRRWNALRPDAAKVTAYLDRHADSFQLFDETKPFAQVAGLHTPKLETKPVSLLIPWLASGNNVPMFGNRTEADPPALRPAEAARALVTSHCWDTAAIKSGAADDPKVKAGKTTGNPTGPVGQLGVVIPLGRNLAETLLLNMPIVPQGLSPADQPQWRRAPFSGAWDERPAEGILDLLTWQARRIRLVPEIGDGGQTVVRQVVLAAGDRLALIDPGIELHTAWQQVAAPRAGQAPVKPLRHRQARALWQGLGALLQLYSPGPTGTSTSTLMKQISTLEIGGCLPSDLRLQVLAVGAVYGNQSAVIEDVIMDTIRLPLAALGGGGEVRDLLLEVVEQADQVRRAADQLMNDLRRAAGGDALPWDKGEHLGEQVVFELGGSVLRLLAGLQAAPDRVDDGRVAWRRAARSAALRCGAAALDAAPPAAFLGRDVALERGRQRLPVRLSSAEGRYRGQVRSILGS